MTDEELQSYHQLRADNGFPKISDAEALIEATSLVNFLRVAYENPRFNSKDPQDGGKT